MILFNAKLTASLVFIPVLVLALNQSSSCRSGTPKDSAASSANRGSSNINSIPTRPPTNIPNENMNRSSDDANRRADDQIWGGPHVRLTMKTGGAELEFDCAHGEITTPIEPDAEGRFDVPGTFVREGGPTRTDRSRSGRPARYSGRIERDTMTLNVKLVDTDQSIETFTLTRGSEGRLWKCR
jgi:hypothetical protein